MKKITSLLILLLFALSCTKDENFQMTLINTASHDTVFSVDFTPSDFVMDKDGDFYLTNSVLGKVLKLDSSGQVLSEVGRFGAGPGEFSKGQPIRLAISDEQIFAYSIGGVLFHVFSKELEYITSISVNSQLMDLKVISNDFLLLGYVDAERDDINVEIVELANNSIGQTRFSSTESTHKNFYFRNIRYYTPLDNSRYLLSYAYVNSYTILDVNGQPESSFSFPGFPSEITSFHESRFTPPPGMEAPKFQLITGTAFDESNSQILVLEGDFSENDRKRIHSFDTDGNYLSTMDLPFKIDSFNTYEGSIYGLKRSEESTEIIVFHQE